jgi:hypothetical protein
MNADGFTIFCRLFVKKIIIKDFVFFYEITYPDNNSEKGFLISACESKDCSESRT